MVFVNEYISPEDRAKYGLDELDAQYQRRFFPMSHGPDFTIDRESYLRLIKIGRETENEGSILYFGFYIDGNLYILKFFIEEAGSLRAHACRKYTLLKTYPDEHVDMENVYPFLKEALMAFRESGIFSKCTSFEAEFNF